MTCLEVIHIISYNDIYIYYIMGYGWLMLAIHTIFYPFYDQRVDPLYEPSKTSPPPGEPKSPRYAR